MATDKGAHPTSPPGPLPRPAHAAAAPEGLALDADALGQAAEEGGRALLDHMLHPQAPLDVLQQAAQEAQEVLGRADGAGHRLCGETGSARRRAGGAGQGAQGRGGERRGGGGARGKGARGGARLTLQHFVGQHRVGQVGISLPGGAGLPQPLHQAAVLFSKSLLVRLLDPAGSRGVGRAGPLGGQVRRQGLRAGAPPPEHRLLQGLQVGLAPIQGAAGEVDTHGVDADVVWGPGRGPGSGKRTPQQRRGRLASPPRSLLTDVVGLVKDDHGLAGQLLGHQVGNLGVQQVVVAVDHHVGVQDLGAEGAGSPRPPASAHPHGPVAWWTPPGHISPSQAGRGEAKGGTQAGGQTDTDMQAEARNKQK